MIGSWGTQPISAPYAIQYPYDLLVSPDYVTYVVFCQDVRPSYFAIRLVVIAFLGDHIDASNTLCQSYWSSSALSVWDMHVDHVCFLA